MVKSPVDLVKIHIGYGCNTTCAEKKFFLLLKYRILTRTPRSTRACEAPGDNLLGVIKATHDDWVSTLAWEKRVVTACQRVGFQEVRLPYIPAIVHGLIV